MTPPSTASEGDPGALGASFALYGWPPQGPPDWHVLACGVGLWQHFFDTWHRWRNASEAPRRLHYTAIEPVAPVALQWLEGAQAPALAHPNWTSLAQQLASQWWGLLPGTHRLELEGGRLRLTLHIGAPDAVLPTLDAEVDNVYLGPLNGGADTDPGAWGWPAPLLRGLGRMSRRGTRLFAPRATPQLWADLRSAGFVPAPDPVASSAQAVPADLNAGLGTGWPAGLHALYDPSWVPAPSRRPRLTAQTRSAVVVGGGLAGSAVAYSLAQRGWQVTVLDAAPEPAAGASALPGGMVAPHVSPDDALLSRMSRSGVRMTLSRAAQLLAHGSDWALSGVLEHRVDAPRGLPRTSDWQRWGSDWSRPATESERQACGLGQAHALWHVQAGWIRPAALVRAQLQQPGIAWRGGQTVDRLEASAHGWRALGTQGQVLAEAPHLVLATAWQTRHLLQALGHHQLPLHALRGQVTWGRLAALPSEARDALPPFPVNGHGALLHGVPGPDGSPAWLVGSTFERAVTEPVVRPEDRQDNLRKLHRLLPRVGQVLAPAFEQAHDWAGVRCTLPDRFPAVGPVAPEALTGLHVCTGLGARGLTLSVLCGEWLAAQLQGEPWPLQPKLAAHLRADRFQPKA